MEKHPYQCFENEVAQAFTKLGFKAETMPDNNPGFDILISDNNNQRIVIQCKDYKSPITVAHVQALYYFLDSNPDFKEAILVSGSKAKKPFAKTVDLLFAEDENKTGFFQNIGLAVFKDGILYSYPDMIPGGRTTIPPVKPLSIAVCALKGGVGKTTISAHLAGALTLSGLNVILVDANPPQNSLIKLMDPGSLDKNGKFNPDYASGIILPNVINPIDCFPLDYWKEVKSTEPNKFGVVYDCAPSMKDNDSWVFENVDICLIPLNICPLGIGKGLTGGKNCQSSLEETVSEIRKINPKIKFYIVESNKFAAAAKIKKGLELRTQVISLAAKLGVKLLDSFIPNSQMLYFWGDQPGKLAFETFAGKCLPKLAFESLAEELMSEILP